MKKIAFLMAVLMLTLALTSCGLMGEKSYTVNGMTLTVKGMFSEQNDLAEGFDLILISPKAGVMVLRETFDVMEDAGYKTDISVKEYAEICMENNQLSGAPVEEDGLTYFTYTAEADGTEFTYMGFCFRGAEAYWLVQMYSATSDFDSMKPEFITWAKSVTFA